MTFDVDARDFRHAADALELAADIAGSILGAALEDIGAEALDDMRRRAGRHKRTGRMIDQITERDTGADFGTIVRVHAGGSIVPIIVGGSRAHDIAPIRPRALTIGSRVGGRVRSFAARVHHPGTRGDPFVAAVLDDSVDVAELELATAGDRIVAELAADIGGI